jgi:hypothetical protein
MGSNILSGSVFTGWIADTTSKDIVGVVNNNSNEATFCVPGTYTWTAPSGVTSISAVCVSGGAAGTGSAGGAGGNLVYKNNISPITPGKNYLVVVGTGGASTSAPGGNSAILDSTVNTTITTQNVTSGEFIQTTPGLYATPTPTAVSGGGGTINTNYNFIKFTALPVGILTGHTVTGPSIPSNTVVLSVDSTNKIVYLSQAASSSTSSGTYTFSYAGSGWQVPSGITSISVLMIGGGGAGGTGLAAGGGGGGATTYFTITGLTPGTYLNYSVGAGGTSCFYLANGTNNGVIPQGGTSTSITINSLTYSANGGGAAGITGGQSGTAGGSVNYCGGGGGAGGYAGSGGNGAGYSGTGGTNPFTFSGGGGGSAQTTPTGNGITAFGSFSGGSGGPGFYYTSGTPTLTAYSETTATGGGGGGGYFVNFANTSYNGTGYYGGGVGIYGQGSSGATGSGNGNPGSGGSGKTYGGGGPGAWSATSLNSTSSVFQSNNWGGPGIIRIVYPAPTYSFPLTNVNTTVPANTLSSMTLSSVPTIYNGFPIAFETAIGGLSSNTVYYASNIYGSSFNLSSTDQTTNTLSFTTGTYTNVNLFYPTIRAAGASSINSQNLGNGINLGGAGNTSGGGGAGGYTGAGAPGGSGAAAGGGAGGGPSVTYGGGGVNLYGPGTSGIIGNGGSGGYNSTSTGGGLFGGGGGRDSSGAGGAVRIVWGSKNFSSAANAATTSTSVTSGTVTITSTLNGSPALATNSAVASSSNISNGIITINNNPTGTGQAQFTIAAPTATIDTLNLNTTSGGFNNTPLGIIGPTGSNLISVPPKPTNYKYVNTPSITGPTGLIFSPRTSNYNVVELDVPGKDLSSEITLITQPRSDSSGAARKTDQNLSTQDDVLNKIGWIGGTNT